MTRLIFGRAREKFRENRVYDKRFWLARRSEQLARRAMSYNLGRTT